jgi:glycosyltransferase involved in cell wall biosynthesis
VILTRDNADTLPETLASVAFADEIVVVDSGSTDGTLELARRAGARVISHALAGFGEQRNLGWREATGVWVLALDSDEALDAEASRAIEAVARRDPDPAGPAAYEMLWRNYFLGHALLHGGLEADFHTRLARRERSRWVGEIHEQLEVDGAVGRLPGLVHHQTSRDLRSRLTKVGRYAERRSTEMRARGEKSSLVRAVWQPVRFFAGRVIVRRGYRDGIYGVAWWWLLATEILLAHLLLSLREDDGDGGARRE